MTSQHCEWSYGHQECCNYDTIKFPHFVGFPFKIDSYVPISILEQTDSQVKMDSISRIERCDHWNLWDDCYECGEDFLMNRHLDSLGERFVYLHSPTATVEENTVTGWPYRAE